MGKMNGQKSKGTAAGPNLSSKSIKTMKQALGPKGSVGLRLGPTLTLDLNHERMAHLIAVLEDLESKGGNVLIEDVLEKFGRKLAKSKTLAS